MDSNKSDITLVPFFNGQLTNWRIIILKRFSNRSESSEFHFVLTSLEGLISGR